MKLLMIYAGRFAYRTRIKNLDFVATRPEENKIENALVGFIQVEKADEDDIFKVETKLIKNLKWAAKKNDTQKIVLHSFAHLSMSKADEKITQALFDRSQARLQNAGYESFQTPFGYFLDLDIQAPGLSLARVFKEF